MPNHTRLSSDGRARRYERRGRRFDPCRRVHSMQHTLSLAGRSSRLPADGCVLRLFRRLAQPGRAGRLGRQGRKFNSCTSDQLYADLAHLEERLFCKQRVASSNLAVGPICAVTQSRTPAVATDRLRAGCDGAAPAIRRAQAVMRAESLCACPRKATGTDFAPVVELADTPGSEPGAARLPSSTLGGRTTTNHSRLSPQCRSRARPAARSKPNNFMNRRRR